MNRRIRTLTPLVVVTLLAGGAGAEIRTSRVGTSTTRSSSVGTRTQRFDPRQAIQQQVQQAIEAQGEGSRASSGTRGAGASGGGEEGESGGFVVYGEPDPRLTWQERVEKARAELDVKDRRALARSLRSSDPAEVFVVLSQEAEGRVRFKERVLVDTLRRTRHRVVARAAVVLLGKRRTPTAFAALGEHIRRHGLADASAVKVLWAAGGGSGREVFLSRASLASGDDEASLLCIRALALQEGPRVTQLLERLSTDWSPRVRKATEEALRMRRRAGLPVATEIKPIPYGEDYEDILEAAPEIEDLSEVYDDGDHSGPRILTGETDEASPDENREP